MPVRMATIEASHHRMDDRVTAGRGSALKRSTTARCESRACARMLWIDQALNRGRGRSFAFALTYRSEYWTARTLVNPLPGSPRGPPAHGLSSAGTHDFKAGCGAFAGPRWSTLGRPREYLRWRSPTVRLDESPARQAPAGCKLGLPHPNPSQRADGRPDPCPQPERCQHDHNQRCSSNQLRRSLRCRPVGRQ
jgi:hypothetical protein